MAAVVKGTCAFCNRRAQQRGANDLTNVWFGLVVYLGRTALVQLLAARVLGDQLQAFAAGRFGHAVFPGRTGRRRWLGRDGPARL